MATAPEDAVRARRRLTNKLIAAHDAARLRPFFMADMKLIVGDGDLILGAEAVLQAFAGQFSEPGFVAYVRQTETASWTPRAAARPSMGAGQAAGRIER